MPTPELIPTAEAAALAGVSVKTMIRWATVPPLKVEPAQKLPGLRGAYLFNRSDIESLLPPERAAS